MNKKEFLKELEERLIGISKEDKKEILQDYEEHFRVGRKKKRTEEEISRSLGYPKDIARDIRKELLGKEDGNELKTEAIETWVSIKKFSKQIFNETKNKIDELSNDFDINRFSHWFVLILTIIVFFILTGIFDSILLFILGLVIFGYFIYRLIEREDKGSIKNKKIKNKKTKSQKKSGGRGALRITLVLLFNILIFIWIWISLFFIVLGFFIAGIAMIIAGVLAVIFSIICLVNYYSLTLKNLLFSFLFAGTGVIILGILLTCLFEKLMKLFLKFTKAYFKLNQRFIKK